MNGLVSLGRALLPALALGWALVPGCERDPVGVVAPRGVVWERITPASIGEADRPDWRGDSIAFQVKPGTGAFQTAVAHQDGAGIEIVPEPGGANARAPRWVGGGLLVYTSDFGDPQSAQNIWYRERATGGIRELTQTAGQEWTPSPRPGGPGIVYVEGSGPQSGRLVLIPDTAAAPLATIYLTPGTLQAGEPDWNPAGDAICFSAEGPNGTRQIWMLSMSDTLPVQLTVPPGPGTIPSPQIDRSPRFSPGGGTILMVSNRGGAWGVWSLSPLGEARGLRVIAQDEAGAEIRSPAWSPDGARILLSSDRSGGRSLWRLSRLGL